MCYYVSYFCENWGKNIFFIQTKKFGSGQSRSALVKTGRLRSKQVGSGQNRSAPAPQHWFFVNIREVYLI